jgi:ABC-2 type transport system ATP-binding protein
MKVLDMLEFLGTLKGSSPRDARRESEGWLAKLEISDWATKKVEELSKGMQQKIQFAAAVLGKPPILILDEPFSGMDPVNQNLFKDAILELNRDGTTIVFSTHQMETAERLCKEIALINKGKVVLSGSLSKVKEGFGKNSLLLEYDGMAASFMRFPASRVSMPTARTPRFGSTPAPIRRPCSRRSHRGSGQEIRDRRPHAPQHLHREGRRGRDADPGEGRRCITS